ncbi:MAG: multiheme c-type cytochrome [bacterium]
MKTFRILGMLLIVVFLAALCLQAQNKNVGVKICKMCHQTEKQGKQFGIWEKTPHAEAFKTLASEKAMEVAKKKNIAKPQEAKECLDCHSPIDKDGVSCENCHGAGSAYKTMAIMKDKAKAIAAGLTDFKDKAAIEKFCKTCHNEKSPTFKGFKFDEMWGKIKHSVPKA